jgi:hypothetical protein
MEAMMMYRPVFLFLFLLSFISVSCNTAQAGQENAPVTTLESPSAKGARTFVFSGTDLDAKKATVNGLCVDTSSVQAIDLSVSAIFSSNYTSGTVIAESSAASADYTIDYTVSGTKVSDIYYGVNIQIASKKFLTMPKYRELVRHLKIDIARFPGGQERVKYDRYADPDSPWEFGESGEYQFLLTGDDIRNYISLCTGNGIKADPEFNLFTSDPSMWSSLADQIVNGLSYNLEYMSAGNEPDINTKKNWTFFKAKTRDEALDSYMSRYLENAAEIRKVKPSLTFILGELSQNGEDDLPAILDRVLPQAALNPPGAFSVHWYLLGDWGQGVSDPGYPSIEHLAAAGNSGINVSNLNRIHDTLETRLAGVLPGTLLVVGEWGPSWSATDRASDVLDSVATGLFTAEVLEYGKIAGFDSMQYFSLSDPAGFAPWNIAMICVDGESFTVRPQYYVRMMHKYAWGDTFIPVENGRNKDYSVYASKQGEDNYLMCVNRTENQSFTRTVKTVDESGSRDYDVLMLPHSLTMIKLPPLRESVSLSRLGRMNIGWRARMPSVIHFPRIASM